ncbi:MAG: hypothetical protein MUF42_08905 [Cytophagaceae bacterium]|nr:hypothetical protein [Cytophagaceae bacterium]
MNRRSMASFCMLDAMEPPFTKDANAAKESNRKNLTDPEKKMVRVHSAEADPGNANSPGPG